MHPALPAGMAAPFSSVTGYLSWDHDRLDAILVEVGQLIDIGDLETARTRFDAFREGLQRHIRVEEEMLFPLFERRTGFVNGPTAVMRDEHRSIQRSLELMNTSLGQHEVARFREGHAMLLNVLPEHNAKEEQILYPLTDQALSEQDRLDLTRQLERF